MHFARYDINQYSIETLLTWIKSDEIAIPEIQRPFVWNAAKVRDFIDSLYRGYPVGYLVTWRSPAIRLKDGTISTTSKRILIDGQQRAMALWVALLSKQVVDKNYKKARIIIAFHPGKERFEVANAAIRRDRAWIDAISIIFDRKTRIRQLVDNYCKANPSVDKYEIDERVERLRNIRGNSLGFIELHSNLEVENVAEIFIRINSQGAPLNAADFAMSKMAASAQYNGHLLRKSIDYFCHLAASPEAYDDLAQDDDFTSTYFRVMEWLKDGKDDLYNPTYIDILRVAFTLKFKRGRLEDLVALLSGRNFEKRTFEEAIVEKSLHALEEGIRSYMNETNFKRFVMILRSAGFVNSSLIRSQNTVNFAYILYLTLRTQSEAPERIESLVRRWFVMSVLTRRYTNSPETAFSDDIGNIDRQGVAGYLDTIEQADLSDTFWEVGLPQQMDTSVTSSPYFNVFLASQVKGQDKGFLSRDITVRDLLEGQWHIHHVFPRRYLQQNGFPRSQYNQIANYVVMQGEINIAIGATPPSKYFLELQEQCRNGIPKYGGITDICQLHENLDTHCIPKEMDVISIELYDIFIQHRRKLMAAKIRDYYRKL